MKNSKRKTGQKDKECIMAEEKEIKELYGYEVGLNQDLRPPLDVYRPDDPESFVK